MEEAIEVWYKEHKAKSLKSVCTVGIEHRAQHDAEITVDLTHLVLPYYM